MRDVEQTTLLEVVAEQLHAHRQAIDEAGWHRQAGNAGQVGGDGVDVFQVGGYRVGVLLAEFPGQVRRGWAEDHVDVLERRDEVVLDQASDLLGLDVVGIVITSRQRVGADHDAPLDLGTEAFATRALVQVLQVFRILAAVAEAHAVETRQVGAGLGRGDHVVGRDGVLHVRQRDVLDGGAELFQLLDHGHDLLANARVQAGTEVLLGQADTQAGERLGQGCQVVIDRLIDAGRILGVETSHGAEQQRTVLGGAGQRAALIEAGGIGDHAPARDAAVGRLDAGEVGQCGRLADRAAGVGTGSRGQQSRGHGSGGTARGAAGYPAGVPGVLHRAVVAGLVGRAHGELVHVQLAEGDGAGGLELVDHGGVVGRLEAGEDLRAAGGQHALGAEQILVRDRRAEQGAGFASGAAGVGGLGLLQREVLGHGDKAVELRVELLDAAQQALGQLGRGELLVGECAGDLGQGQLMHGGGFPYSMTLGTRYRPLSTAGAMAW